MEILSMLLKLLESRLASFRLDCLAVEVVVEEWEILALLLGLLPVPAFEVF